MGTNNQQKSGGKKAAGGMLGIALLLAYWFLQPVLNQQLGLNLPSLRGTGSTSQQQSSEASSATLSVDVQSAEDTPAIAESLSGNNEPVDLNASDAAAESAEPEPSIADEATAASDLLHGILREVQPDRYLSPAGLMYGPGSQEGHRLKHLERHTKDQPTRPGSHGVFDGGMAGALKVIDEGFAKAKSGGSGITTEEDGDRTIHTISMGKRIGFVGGRDGNRRNKPMARRLRIVLEGNRVITAFPL